MTTPHPHAHLMALYAQDAAETDKPWERWACRAPGGAWINLWQHPNWDIGSEYIRKPKTIKANGFDVPAPLKEMPTSGAAWLAIPHAEDYANIYSADGQDWKRLAAKRGLFHATKEAAVAHAKAMLGIDPEGTV